MKKIMASVGVLALLIGLAVALAQPAPPPGSPPPPPPPGWGPPPGGPGGGPPGGPPGGPMGGPPGGMHPGMDPGARMEAWQKFKEEHPEDAEVITDMIEKYPELRMIFMIPGQGGPAMGPGGRRGQGRMEHGRRPDPQHIEMMRQLRDMRQQAFTLGEKYRNTTNAKEKKKIETDLRTLLGQIYELRLKEMQYRVKRVEERLADVKGELAKYEKDRNGVIDAWFKQLTGEENYKEF